MKGHWSRTCRTLKHLDDFYQASIKENGKDIDMNFADVDGLDYDYDFFGGSREKTNYVMNDENTTTE